MILILAIAFLVLGSYAFGGSGGGGGGGGFSKPGAVIGGLGSIVQGVGQDVQSSIANIMNAQNRQWALEELGRVGPESNVGSDIRSLLQNQVVQMRGNAADTMQQYYDIRNNAVAGYQALRERGMNDIVNSGVQERRDINTAFDNRASQTQAGLTERGLGATTAIPGALSQNERMRSDAIGGLNERLLQQRRQTDAALTGQVIGQTQALDLGGLNLSQQLFGRNLGAETTSGQFAYQQYLDDALRRIGLISGFTNIGPDPALSANIASGLGSLAVNPPRAQSVDTTSPALIGGGIGLATSLGTTKIIFGCVDENTKITMADGTQTPLRDIRKGMMVLGTSGQARRVLGVDLGKQIANGLHIRIVFNGTHIVISRDHLIGARPAGDWKVGDSLGALKIKRIETASPEVTGDLLLEFGEGYIANGIAVASMLSYQGVSERELDDFHAMMA